jgi:hypothetical protein
VFRIEAAWLSSKRVRTRYSLAGETNH